MMDINVRGVVLGTKYAAISMAKNKSEEWKSIIKWVRSFSPAIGLPSS
jgi:hypothetical protein